MNWFTAFVLYVIIWWTLLFAVLPLWTRPEADARQVSGGWRGAPQRPLLLRKFLVTTAIATVICGGCVMLITSQYLSFRSGILYMPDK